MRDVSTGDSVGNQVWDTSLVRLSCRWGFVCVKCWLWSETGTSQGSRSSTTIHELFACRAEPWGTDLLGSMGFLPSLLHLSTHNVSWELLRSASGDVGVGAAPSTCRGGGQVHAPIAGLGTGAAEVRRAAVGAERRSP